MNAVDFSEHAVSKGARLYDQGRTTTRGADECFVSGDHGIYLVRAFTGGGLTCTCPARGGGCSHIVAALLAWGDAMRTDQASQERGTTNEEPDA